MSSSEEALNWSTPTPMDEQGVRVVPQSSSSPSFRWNLYSLCFILILLFTIYLYRFGSLNFWISDDDLFRLSLAQLLAEQNQLVDDRIYWLPIPLSIQSLFYTLFPNGSFLVNYIACSLFSLMSFGLIAVYLFKKKLGGLGLCIFFSLPLVFEFSTSVLSEPVYWSLFVIYFVSTIINRPQSRWSYFVSAVTSMLLCMTRYEAWLIVGLYNLSLFYRFEASKLKVLLAHIPAWIFMLSWMIFNYIQHGSPTAFTNVSEELAMAMPLLERVEFMIRSFTQGTLPLLFVIVLLIRILYEIKPTRHELFTVALAFSPFVYMIATNNIGRATPERFVLGPAAILLLFSAIRIQESDRARGRIALLLLTTGGILLFRAWQACTAPPLIPPSALSSVIEHSQLNRNSKVLIFDYHGIAQRDLQVYRLVYHQHNIICYEWLEDRSPISGTFLSEARVDFVLCQNLGTAEEFFQDDVSLRLVQHFWGDWKIFDIGRGSVFIE